MDYSNTYSENDVTRNEDPKEAAGIAISIEEISPIKEHEDLFKIAIFLMESKLFEKALACSKCLVIMNSTNDQYRLQKGKIELALGLIGDAQESFRIVKSLNPNEESVETEMNRANETAVSVMEGRIAVTEERNNLAYLHFIDALVNAHACKELLMAKVDMMLYSGYYSKVIEMIDSYDRTSLEYLYSFLFFLHHTSNQDVGSKKEKDTLRSSLIEKGFDSHPKVANLLYLIEPPEHLNVEFIRLKEEFSVNDSINLTNQIFSEQKFNNRIYHKLHLKLAMFFKLKGDYNLALRYCNSAIVSYEPLKDFLPSSSLSLCYCVIHDCYNAVNNPHDAKRSFETAKEVDPETVYMYMAIIRHNQCPCQNSTVAE